MSDKSNPVIFIKDGINSPKIVNIITINIHFLVYLPFKIILIIDAGKLTILAIANPKQAYKIPYYSKF